MSEESQNIIDNIRANLEGDLTKLTPGQMLFMLQIIKILVAKD